MSIVQVASNAVTIGIKSVDVTFWKRAMASCGMIEAYRAERNFYTSVTLWGWMVSFNVDLPERKTDTDRPYHHTFISRYLKWADYRAKSPWAERALVKFVQWALSKRAVQQVVADAFNGPTPMCYALKRAVEDGLDDHRPDISADDVEGLERFVESVIDDFARHQLEDAVNDAVDVRKVTELVVDELTDSRNFTNLVADAVETHCISDQVAQRVEEEVAKIKAKIMEALK